MNMILTGGGTGGHICPLLGLADTARSLDPSTELAFVGEATGLENRLVPEAGYALRAVKGRPLPRRFSAKSVGAVLALAAAVPRAAALLRELDPDVVIGTGGYASACVLYAAARLRVPTLLIELNTVPGRTTRLLAKRMTRVCIQFEETRSHLPRANCQLTGSPVRTGFRTATRAHARGELGAGEDELCLLAFGGSQAASTINRAVAEALPLLAAGDRKLRVLHMCGEAFLADAQDQASRYAAHPSLRYQPDAYRDDLWTLCAAADVVLCRAGGSSLSELAVVGVPAILVPYPYATDDHQAVNAAHFAALGAAVVVTDGELTGPRLNAEVDALAGDPQRRQLMAERARSAGFPEAAERILELAREVTTTGKH